MAVGINAGHAQSGDPCDQINNPLNQFFQQNNPQFKKRQQDCAKLKTLQTERDRLLTEYQKLQQKMDQFKHRTDSIGDNIRWMIDNGGFQLDPAEGSKLQRQLDQAGSDYVKAKGAVDSFAATLSGNATGHSTPFPVSLRNSRAEGDSIGARLDFNLTRALDLSKNQHFEIRVGAWHNTTKITTAPWQDLPALGASSVENRSWTYGGSALYRVNSIYFSGTVIGDNGRSTVNDDYRLLGSATTKISSYMLDGTAGFLVPVFHASALDLSGRVAYLNTSADAYTYASGLAIGQQELTTTIVGVQAKFFSIITAFNGVVLPFVRVAYDHAPDYSQTLFIPVSVTGPHSYDFLIDKSTLTFEAGVSGWWNGWALNASYIHQDSSTASSNGFKLSAAIPFGPR